MKTQIHALRSTVGSGRLGARLGGALALLLLASCQSGGPSLVDPALAGSAADEGLLPLSSSPSALTQPEPGAAASEYTTRPVTLRLFGTSGVGADSPSGADESAAFATLADTATWATTNYHLGQVVGRGLRIVAISEDGIELSDSLSGGARLRLRAGEDLTVRLVEHRFDRAVIDEGQHQFRLQGGSMKDLLATYGLGVTSGRMPAAFAGYRGLRLLRVGADGALARMGLQSGDRLLAIDGHAANAELLATLPERLSQPGVLLLTVARGGNVWEAAYVIN